MGNPPSRHAQRAAALAALAGVGDAVLGQWEEWSGYAYHIRRRLTAQEAQVTGPVLDVRGTPEGKKRYLAMKDRLSTAARVFAQQELQARTGIV